MYRRFQCVTVRWTFAVTYCLIVYVDGFSSQLLDLNQVNHFSFLSLFYKLCSVFSIAMANPSVCPSHLPFEVLTSKCYPLVSVVLHVRIGQQLRHMNILWLAAAILDFTFSTITPAPFKLQI